MKNTYIFALFMALSLGMWAQQINPITQATLDAYADILAKNPNDYSTLYQRAAQYFQLNLYNQAADDILKAINATPGKDKDMKAREYALLGNILTEQKEYAKALEATEAALAFSPSNYSLLYQKGNLCLHIGNIPAARTAFQAMQKIKSRSQEALIGLARCDIAEGKYDDAKEKMQQAEDFNSVSATTYCRIGDLYAEMNENRQAALQYITAYALSDGDDNRAIFSLSHIATKDYPALNSAFDYALEKSGQSLPLYYLKANLALTNGHYADAYNAFTTILAHQDGRQASVYDGMARTCKALGKLNEAMLHINRAILLEDTPLYRLTRAEIENATGKYNEALTDGNEAKKLQTIESDAAIEMAIANLNINKKDAALQCINEAVMSASPGNLKPIMIRAWMHNKIFNNAEAARTDWQRAASTKTETIQSTALKGLAMALAGKQLDSASVLRDASTKAQNGEEYYWLAVAYAQSGNQPLAMEMLQNAKNAGFDNTYLLDIDTTANLNIAPLRNK